MGRTRYTSPAEQIVFLDQTVATLEQQLADLREDRAHRERVHHRVKEENQRLRKQANCPYMHVHPMTVCDKCGWGRE